jgi:ABC-type transport system involved in multi-copper enzyme maturation permease subunit
MNPGRVFVIATNVFREVIRDRVLYLIGFFALLLGSSSILLPEVSAGNDAKIMLDLGLVAIELLGLVIAIFVGTGLVNKEIDQRTLLNLLAKPLSRSEFIVGKHFGLTAVLAVLVAAMTVIYLGALSLSQVSYPLTGILLTILYQFLALSLITAVAILFGVFTSSLLAILLTFAVYLAGNFSYDLLKLGRLSENPVLEPVTRGLYLVLPDLSRLNFKNLAVYGLSTLPPSSELLSDAAYGLVYTGLLLAIATLIFSRREF